MTTPRVLADHKRVGKRFIPPMAQLGLSDPRWRESLVPEFLWLALLHRRCGYARGAEVARRVAEAARSLDGAPTWFAAMSMFSTIPDEKRPVFVEALGKAQIVDELEHGLAPLHRHYPDHPLAYVFRGPAEVELSPIKELLERLLASRTDIDCVRAQATAMYLAFDAGMLKVLAGSSLADFPIVEDYPKTERSRKVASAVRAALNALTIQVPKSAWSTYFWNRGLQLEECSFEASRR